MDSNLSTLMKAAEAGDLSAAEALFPMLYSELHRLARREIARNMRVTISATTLLHETYLDLARRDGPEFAGRDQFMRYAARVMRGLIIDHLRSRHAKKRGREFEFLSFDSPVVEKAVGGDRELIQLSEALDELATVDRVLAETVDLKFFCGFTFPEIASIQGVSERTAQRNWNKARIYLHRTIRPVDLLKAVEL